jgi:phenylacetate-coenzyme A ligase PaaK-like adenylate-forming protein
VNFNELQSKIFEIHSEDEFNRIALEVFNYQYHRVLVYKHYCDLIKRTPQNVTTLEDIPFLPISFFKTQFIAGTNDAIEETFTSSGTTGSETSKHLIQDLKLYETSFLKGFDAAYPEWKESTIIGLLPSYLERKGSSLIYMVDHLIKLSKSERSTFKLSLDDQFIDYLENNPEPKIMFGVTFALLDIADRGIQLKNTIIIETGGMKGRGKELTRDELHKVLLNQLNPKAIHSEYGMTELLSQAYLKENTFECPNWMKIFIREPSDPFHIKTSGRGAINVIDLANLQSCSFIATDDLGKRHENGEFEVLGRIDHSQIRGCNLLVL